MKFFEKFKKKESGDTFSPPVPKWRPKIEPPIERIIDTSRYYSNGVKDFAVFKHGTIVLLPPGLDPRESEQAAYYALHCVFHAHPDMRPQVMDDGNLLVMYQHNVTNIVFEDIVQQHWKTIDKNHQRALAKSEVIINPAGENVFDDLGKRALFGRCYMFMDAQDPEIISFERASR